MIHLQFNFQFSLRNLRRPAIGTFYILMLIFMSNTLLAQKQKSMTYFLSVRLLTGESRNGILHTMDEHMLVIKQKHSDSLISVLVSDISVIKIRKVNAGSHILKGTGIIIGSATGFALGYVLGFYSDPGCDDGSCDDLEPEVTGIGSGIVIGFGGGVLGSRLGNPSKKYVIDGQPENFRRMMAQL